MCKPKTTAALDGHHTREFPPIEVLREKLTLDKLKKSIPKEAFEKSLLKSMWFLVFDYAMWGLFTYAFYLTTNSATFATLPAPAQYAAIGAFWMTIGFWMWGIFVVGHDCGHSNFSNYTVVNDTLGNLLHASIMVPYWPWRLSHRRHHMYHNHQTKDYSHPWFTPNDDVSKYDAGANFVKDTPFARESILKFDGFGNATKGSLVASLFMPFFGWYVYLLGHPDGSHWLPVPGSRLWAETATHEKVKCVVSSAICIALQYVVYNNVFEQDINNMVYYYLGPLIGCGWWLVCVTYLQHHSHTTMVYDDSNWSYVLAAFETVDRKFGYGIDYLHHHITDGHVAHHLFFTQIPHYNLPMATEGIRKYLDDNEMSSLYQLDQTQDFPIRLHKYFYEIGFMAQNGTISMKKSE